MSAQPAKKRKHKAPGARRGPGHHANQSSFKHGNPHRFQPGNQYAWKPGQSGNPSGKSRFARELEDFMQEVAVHQESGESRSRDRILIERLWHLALIKERPEALRQLLDRYLGKVPLPIVSGTPGDEESKSDFIVTIVDKQGVLGPSRQLGIPSAGDEPAEKKEG